MFVVDVDATDLISLLNELVGAKRVLGDNLERAAEAAVADIKQRISEGKNASGRYMVTKSAQRLGRYSESHGRKRRKRGLRVDIVNLQYTGHTYGSFRHLLTRRSSAGLWAEAEAGFDNPGASQIATYNDEYFGNAYALRPSEADRAFREYMNGFDSPLFRDL